MADSVVPHFQNDAGVPVIEIGSQEFMADRSASSTVSIRNGSLARSAKRTLSLCNSG